MQDAEHIDDGRKKIVILASDVADPIGVTKCLPDLATGMKT